MDSGIIERNRERPIESLEDKHGEIYLRGSDLIYWLKKYGKNDVVEWLEGIVNLPPIGLL